MVSELFTVYGSTDGSNTTGTISLKSTIFNGSVNYIRVPKGMKVKLWCKRISGKPATITFNFTRDVTASTPTWVTIDSEELASEGVLELEKRRPIVVYGYTGKEAVSIGWGQSTAQTTNVSVEVEITDE